MPNPLGDWAVAVVFEPASDDIDLLGEAALRGQCRLDALVRRLGGFNESCSPRGASGCCESRSVGRFAADGADTSCDRLSAADARRFRARLAACSARAAAGDGEAADDAGAAAGECADGSTAFVAWSTLVDKEWPGGAASPLLAPLCAAAATGYECFDLASLNASRTPEWRELLQGATPLSAVDGFAHRRHAWPKLWKHHGASAQAGCAIGPHPTHEPPPTPAPADGCRAYG